MDGIVTFGQAKESGGGFGARNGRKAGLEKTRFFKINLAQWVFLGGFLGFFVFFLIFYIPYIFERENF